MDAKLLSVRMVTQDNNKENMAGIDKIKSISPDKRLILAKSLVISGVASPLLQVWVPLPGKREKRLFGVPTLNDRCLQVLFKLALEPEWEAKFENNSYGFRPGKRSHDAIAAIRSFIQKKSKYVLHAGIAECFDCIDHQRLLEKIGMRGKFRKQLKSWLKVGVLDNNVFLDTEIVTSLGVIIAPLLANIALHGIEEYAKGLIKHIPFYGATGRLIKSSRRCDSLDFVRYADQFVILHPYLSVISLIQNRLPDFLGGFGLILNHSKSFITNTLEIKDDTKDICPGLNGKPGFNFLGFYIRQFKTNHLSAYGYNKLHLGFRTLIIPSLESRKEHQAELHKLVLKFGKHLSQDILIKKLNRIIRSWANNFGKSDANMMGLLVQMYYLLYLKLRRWSKRIYKTSGKGRVAFRKVGSDNWRFATENIALIRHFDYSQPLSRYVKVKGESSPFDDNQPYWSNRLLLNNLYNTRTMILLRVQKCYCNWCHSDFKYYDILEVDHIIPKAKGGGDEFENLQLLHRHCHDIKSSFD
jgi:RNA-directed DNA polymerase